MVVAEVLDEIARREFHVVEFREIENVRFRQHGRGDIERLTYLYHIIEKMRVRQFFRIFVYELFADSTVRH